MVMPGAKGKLIEVDLEECVAIEVGSTFAIREGGRTIGKGVVTKPLDSL